MHASLERLHAHIHRLEIQVNESAKVHPYANLAGLRVEVAQAKEVIDKLQS